MWTLMLGLALAQDAAPEATAAPEVETVSLDEAYQREMAFLLAERDALKARLGRVQSEGAEAVEEARVSVDTLQGKLVRLERDADVLEAQLLDAERRATAAQDGLDRVGQTLFQASESLNTDEIKVDAESMAEQAVGLETAFRMAGETYAEAGTIRRSPGNFFLADGTRVDGEIIRLGRIASWGVAEGMAGALQPVGEGHLKLRTDGAATAQALANGSTPSSWQMFLYENEVKRIDEAPEKTLQSVLAAGGTVGYVIVFLGLIAGLLVLLRAGMLALASGGKATSAQMLALVRAGRMDQALSVAPGAATGPRVLHSVIERAHQGAEKLEDVVAEAILSETPRVERFGAAILVIAAVAPLLGLLGTVTGMIATFDIITEYGTGDPRRLSGGISEALVTTQLGLIVAIPALLLGNLLKGTEDSVMLSTEDQALQLLNTLQSTSDVTAQAAVQNG